ncbi:MAG: glycoside hydrolase family 65 protein [Spirochaetaceae bacterium]|nr:MAG: glycoside hydrolase family 65 protein [Spirochaetaceae bacterium]
MQLRDNLATESGWDIIEQRFETGQLVTNGSNFMTGNGYLGYRGTFPEWRKAEYVGCVVSDTYDNADGKWTELCTVPNGLFAEAELVDIVSDRSPVSLFEGNTFSYERSLNVRYGVQRRSVEWGRGNEIEVSIRDARFASYTDLHLLCQTYSLYAHSDMKVRFTAGIDGDIWSLNGEHFSDRECGEQDGSLYFDCVTQEKGVPLTVAATVVMTGVQPSRTSSRMEKNACYLVYDFDLESGQRISFNQYMTVYSGNDTGEPRRAALASLEKAVETGYEALLVSHKAVWDDRWNRCHVSIDGDPAAQTVLRYCLYQNAIATPAHTDHLPIGARGLSCQAYQGAAFWDQEIFNLPVFMYTEPEIARRILVYRYRTLNGARKKAEDLGYGGAFYAWVSADTGEEICPSFFFKDVLTGRKIRNHFNDWQIHVSPDIAFTIWKYYQATGDFDFLLDHGAEMMFEIARFLWIRAFYNPARDRYEYIRLLGPDEYHENVDNNLFTNYQAQYSFRRALQIYQLLAERAPEGLATLKRKIRLSDDEPEHWQRVLEKIYIPVPREEDRVIPQFDRFFELEDLRPEELESRLLDPGEYWGWPNGVAVHTQVAKQADVIQLFALHPDAYERDVMKANYAYYEPRAQHGSSLSLSVYSMVASWIGRMDQAYEYFMRSCTVDLFNANKAVSGGTFIGGIHTAASGAAWQIVVSGFAGARVHQDGVYLDPNMPPQWNRVEFLMTFRQNDLRIEIGRSNVRLQADPANTEAVPVCVRGERHSVAPGETVEL